MRNLICIVLLLGSYTSYSQQVGGPAPEEEPYWAQEELFVHTDKSVYVIGESVLFSTYCLDKYFHFPSPLSKVVYIELINRDGTSVLQEKIWMKEGLGSGSLYLPSSIPSGIYSLQAYTSWMKNEGPDAFFHQALCIVNPGIPPAIEPATPLSEEGRKSSPLPTSNLSISLAKSLVTHREKVEIALEGLPEEWGDAQLSISIHKTDTGLFFYKKPIQEVLAPSSSQFPIFTEGAIDWKSFSFQPETQTHVIRGRCEEASLSELPLFINFPGQSIEMYALKPDSYGNFAVEISPQTRSGDMLIWSPERDLISTDIELLPPFSTTHKKSQLPSFPSSSWRELLESYLYNAQVSYVYADSIARRARNTPPPTYSQPFYGVPRYSYLLDEYTRFPELEEVFLEYVRYALKKRIDGKRYVFIWDEYTNMAAMGNSIPFKEPALVLIDGVPIKDPEVLWEFDVLDIEQADLVTKKYYVGGHTFYGIASFFTYDRNLGGQSLPEGLLRASYQGIQGAGSFFSPSYASEADRNRPQPDFRSTLYWNPCISLDTQRLDIECWSSDDEGLYKVEIQGITETGIPLYAESYFEVKRSL